MTVLSVSAAQKLTYPNTRKVDQVDVLHGVRVADPYRWLEDANSPETAAWVKAQNAVTGPYLASLPERAPFRSKLAQVYNYERYTAVEKAGGFYFWNRHDGKQDRAVLYVSRTLTGSGEVLIDPNRFPDKTVALAGTTHSRDGSLLAYMLQKSGSDWMEVAFMDVASKTNLPDRLQWVKFSGAQWSEDGKGIFYSRYDEPDEKNKLQNANFNQKLFYHRIGTPQADDKLIFFRPEHKEWMYDAFETEGAQYTLVHVRRGSDPSDVYFIRKSGEQDFKPLIPDFEAEFDYVGNEGNRLFFRTTAGAPRGRLIEISAEQPEKSNWKELVPESKDSLNLVAYFTGQFIATYLEDAHTILRRFDQNGKPAGEVGLPGIGTASGFYGRQSDTETFYIFTSYTFPSVVYRYDLKSHTSTVFKRPTVPVDLSKYRTDLVFYNSKDGTRVPMFITMRKDAKRDGTNPALLYGYGGFNIPMTPQYSPSWIAWLEMGGIVANPGNSRRRRVRARMAHSRYQIA